MTTPPTTLRSPFHHAVLALLVARRERLLAALREHLDTSSLDDLETDPVATGVPEAPSRPLELHLRRRGETELRVVVGVEIQLARDDARPPAWLLDHAERHARLRVPAYLVVVTPSSDVAAWAAGPFAFGMITMQPTVLTPIDLLEARGVSFDPALRQRVTTCTDLDVLARWLHRAASTCVAEEVFAP